MATTPEDLAITDNPELRSARQAIAKAHAGLNAARAEYIPDVSLIVQHTYQNGAPLLPENTAAVGVHAEWTISEFGKRIGLVRERKSQVAQAKENLLETERKIRMDVQSETRKVHRSETGLEAARDAVAVRTELVRITNDQVVAKTATSLLSKTRRRNSPMRRPSYSMRRWSASSPRPNSPARKAASEFNLPIRFEAWLFHPLRRVVCASDRGPHTGTSIPAVCRGSRGHRQNGGSRCDRPHDCCLRIG